MKNASFARASFGAAVIACSIGSTAISANAAAVTFFDDFNRPDGVVGNGWLNYAESGSTGTLVISGNVITPSHPSTFSGLYRPVNLASPVTVSLTVSDAETTSGGPFRFDDYLLFGSTGSILSGYGINILRTDSLHSNSQVMLMNNGVVLDTVLSTFQYQSTITPTVTFNPDGSILGSIADGSNVFNFSFGPLALSLPGTNVVFNPSNSGTGRRPYFDDVTVISEVPEPATFAMFGLSLLALMGLRCRTGRA